jgi:hypothetical protein
MDGMNVNPGMMLAGGASSVTRGKAVKSDAKPLTLSTPLHLSRRFRSWRWIALNWRAGSDLSLSRLLGQTGSFFSLQGAVRLAGGPSLSRQSLPPR